MSGFLGWAEARERRIIGPSLLCKVLIITMKAGILLPCADT
jgi:hypothetical protein